MAYNGVLWETNHEGKMKGIKSIGTSCINNPYCLKRQQDGCSICSHCYAMTYMKMRKSLKEHLLENAQILTKTELVGREIPVTNDLIYRFESFGDLQNEQHLRNFIAIANRNPYTTFGLWTKNIWFLDNVFKKQGVEKPSNMRVIVSSPLLNEVLKIDREERPYIDHVFTVFDKNFIKQEKIEINCGARSCLTCGKCYKNDTEFLINEELK